MMMAYLELDLLKADLTSLELGEVELALEPISELGLVEVEVEDGCVGSGVKDCDMVSLREFFKDLEFLRDEKSHQERDGLAEVDVVDVVEILGG